MEKVEKLKNGMILYHASYKIIKNVDLSCCREGLDFGKGFYLTTSKEQAKRFVKNSVGRAILNKKIKKQKYGYINVFHYTDDEEIKEKIFLDANSEWLHFVVKNRDVNIKIKTDDTKYDVIGGKIANDFTARTISIYISGGYGDVGSKEADEMAIKILLPNKLKDQYCFLTKKSLKNLLYVESIKYEF
ncbi:MAG: DUF3990 domain-containing protein [Lachnospiraceae bacterium]|nr:DUF3990 domain-containing protein [Lachnospiraceae bacterium]